MRGSARSVLEYIEAVLADQDRMETLRHRDRVKEPSYTIGLYIGSLAGVVGMSIGVLLAEVIR